ncbi:CS1-pili formation C-terminal domain-containing protein [Pseudomonas vranovensis]|uniref:CS1-pili formation C-terminal domain-containing protein n=1 Tax=Pseudomonas vranovensis TaxID=321661 RepID=UPI0003FD3841|nr:CS1-pili formation C-terminal domain-containing protein [Pseudomonas vranovensis]
MNTPSLCRGLFALVLTGVTGLSLAPARAEPAVPSTLGLLTQAEGLPAEFRNHFFDVPLAVRVDLDGRPLGDAMLVLSRDERVQLLEFTDTSSSKEDLQTMKRWQEVLSEPRLLGVCKQECAHELLALHYSLANSQLSILTRTVEQDSSSNRFHALPEAGSHGLLMRNQLNLSGSKQDLHGTYIAEGLGSIGQWTTTARAQFDRSSANEGDANRYRVSGLYADRMIEDRFYRLGYFPPSTQGLSLQPRTLDGQPHGIVGVMFGSSDSLAINDGQASTTPIYVTPNRPAVVEVYRDDALIFSQAVQPGLQTIDTRRLPGGIYAVEVRLIEDGQITSRNEEFIYKPRNWANPGQRWRYNTYLGQSSNPLSNRDDLQDGGLRAGIIANYLLHPRAVLGLSLENIEDGMQYSTSLDWDVTDKLKLYSNLHHNDSRGNGFDLQSVYAHGSGSLVFSHSRTWLDATPYNSKARETQQTSFTVQQRVDDKNHANLRLSHNSGTVSGPAVDLSWVRRSIVLGSDATWRFSVFDRPGNASSGGERNRGVDVSLTMALGSAGNRVYGNLGSRTGRDGDREQNASLSYQRQVDYGTLRSITGTVNADSFGVGLGGSLEIENRMLSGNTYLQSSSYNGELSGGLNLDSTVGLGDGAVAMSGGIVAHEAAMVVDVETDYTDLELQAFDQQGYGSTLKSGRNLIPVKAYRAGNVQFDFNGDDAPAAVIQPQSANYHLNKGGVAYQKVRIMRTVTVVGRLLNAQGQPLRGAMVINHASRSVSETDGFFAVEMSESTPTLEVRQNGGQQCFLHLDKARYEREKDVLLVGDLTCTPGGLASAEQVKASDA